MMPYNYLLIATVLTLMVAGALAVTRGKRNYLPMDKDATLPLRGVLVMLVIVGHCDTMMPGCWLLRFLHLGTPAVAVFLFMGGYGLMKSYTHGGDVYLRCLPWRTLIKLGVPFMFATLCWAVYLHAIGESISFSRVLVPSIGGDTFLPHAWFVYALVVFTLFFYLSFICFKDLGPRLVTLLSLMIFYHIVLRNLLDWDIVWTYTSFGFLLGVVYALCERRLNAILCSDNGWLTYLAMGILFLSTYVGKMLLHSDLFLDARLCLLGPIMFLALSVLPRCRIGRFGGVIAFEMYLFHCIPKAYFVGMFANPVIYCGVVVLITVAIAAIVHPICNMCTRHLCALLSCPVNH